MVSVYQRECYAVCTHVIWHKQTLLNKIKEPSVKMVYEKKLVGLFDQALCRFESIFVQQ